VCRAASSLLAKPPATATLHRCMVPTILACGRYEGGCFSTWHFLNDPEQSCRAMSGAQTESDSHEPAANSRSPCRVCVNRLQAAKVHAALSFNPDAAAAHQLAHLETRDADELGAAFSTSMHLASLLDAEFKRGADVVKPGWAALLALTGPEDVRAWTVVRVTYTDMGGVHETTPDSYHVVPLEV
jgi:hypothetical protein